MTTTNRNRRTGRYVDTKFTKPCTCGHTLGDHTRFDVPIWGTP